MTFLELQKQLNNLIIKIDSRNLVNYHLDNHNELTEELNKSSFLITLHDVELFKPLFINDKMATFYDFKKNWFNGLDYLYYLKTIHSSTYNTIIESISFFRKDTFEFLDLDYKLLHKKTEWKPVRGTTKTIFRRKNGKPKYALTLAVSIQKNNDKNINLKELTNREKEIGKLLCEGLSRSEIATELTLSEHTVNTHLKNIYKKLNIGKVSELIALFEKYYV